MTMSATKAALVLTDTLSDLPGLDNASPLCATKAARPPRLRLQSHVLQSRALSPQHRCAGTDYTDKENWSAHLHVKVMDKHDAACAAPATPALQTMPIMPAAT